MKIIDVIFRHKKKPIEIPYRKNKLIINITTIICNIPKFFSIYASNKFILSCNRILAEIRKVLYFEDINKLTLTSKVDELFQNNYISANANILRKKSEVIFFGKKYFSLNTAKLKIITFCKTQIVVFRKLFEMDNVNGIDGKLSNFDSMRIDEVDYVIKQE